MKTRLLCLLENIDFLYFLAGLVSSFITYLLRSKGFNGKDWSYRISNGLTCVMLSCGTIMTLHLLYDAPWAWSVPVGIAVGFLGSDLILSTIIKIVEFKFGKGDR